MQFIKPDTNYNFVGTMKWAVIISSLAVAAALAAILFKGFNYGIDFSGGIEMRVDFPSDITIDQVRNSLDETAIEGISVVSFLIPGKNVLSIKAKGERSVATAMAGKEGGGTELPQVAQVIITHLEKTFGPNKVNVISTDMVGPRIGKGLRHQALMATIYCLIGIMVYVGFRFKPSYGAGAVIALAHDVIIVAGIFAVLGREMNLSVVASLLTLAGYSVNDTVIIFDRIREGLTIYRGKPFDEVVNRSVNDTLSRTILTSLVTQLAVVSLYFLGSEIIKDFAFAMVIGIIVGTYSSIYIASPIMMAIEGVINKRRKAGGKGAPQPKAASKAAGRKK